MKSQPDKIQILLDKAGLKKTEARVSLLELLSKTKKPLSVKAIVIKLGQDKVTVYRMLEAMTKKGITRRVDTGEREAQYEMTDSHEDHHHIICLNCKKVADFTGCDADDLITKALKQVKDFDEITHHSFDLFGICNSCSKK